MSHLYIGGSRVETPLELRDLLTETHFREVLKTDDDEQAQGLCDAILPTSMFYGFQLWPNGTWSAVVSYDNLLHDGAGKSAADSLLAALRSVVNILDGHAEGPMETTH